MRDVAQLVEDVVKFEEKKQKLGAYVRENPPRFQTSEIIRESGLLHSVSADSLHQRTVVGVDGGLIQRALHGIDLVLTRAVCAFFTYEHGKLVKHEYVPGKNPKPRVEVIRTPLQQHDFNISASLIRMQEEAGHVLKALEENPDIVLLDGSIVPHYADKPSKDSHAHKEYEKLVELYRELYEKALSRDVLLAGVVEDSRGTQLCQRLTAQYSSKGRAILENSRDTDFLHYVMNTGERTTTIKYTDNVEEHPTLRDVKPASQHVYSYYLRTVSNDAPLRIDFLSENPVKDADKTASLIYPVSAHNSSYGIPTPIIEADQRAKLSGHDLALVEGKLKSKLDFIGLQSLRRERRPF